ncbi:NtaA/DmoA family FMN-dependent monooxygenase [Gulosibacter chungangensis]|uniref:NtaA/DmoA family FMN-dependent monooxygenase n=1 Tax=Gulosibacter chungangensis TaxID=979746 RepID=A0A7J5BBL8_9MICO|nr:NtaA/DmoA family FMN-dependent monooxygenase [Gulosibacter chungangensis]KAB1643543.1 NtaA/DmoA family FMN-dependent monooxygenase [Gulosibacter chungangensis]
MEDKSRTLHLGVMPTGSGAIGDERAWLNPAEPADASVNASWYQEVSAIAEAGLFDFVFLSDSVFANLAGAPHSITRMEPLALLSYLAAGTRNIGLVGTVSTTYQHPYNLARSMMTLDHISGGRAGWHVVTSVGEQAARNFGMPEQQAHETRYARAAESVQVVQALWRSFDEDAFPRDRSTGQFLDPHAVHKVAHHGEFFDVEGPLNIGRSLQGEPVIFQAGYSAPGVRLGAETADVIFSLPIDTQAALAHRARVTEAARSHRPKHLSDPLFMAGIVAITGATETEAQDRYEEFLRLHDRDRELIARVLRAVERDAGKDPVTSPQLTELVTAEDVKRAHKNEGSWLSTDLQHSLEVGHRFNEAIERIAERYRLILVGTPEQLADTFEEWFRSGAADGFILQVSDRKLFRDFVELVVPELQRRGLFRESYPERATLRGLLGISSATPAD